MNSQFGLRILACLFGLVGLLPAAHALVGDYPTLPYREPFQASTVSGAPSQPANTVLVNEPINGRTLPFSIPAPAAVQAGLTGMTIEWAMKQKPAGGGNPDGTLLEGPGFSIKGDFQFGTFGTVFVRFHEARDGVWIGQRNSANFNLSAPDDQWHYYVVTYDLRTVKAYVDGELYSQIWLDNNADRIGPMFDASNRPLGNQITVGSGQSPDSRNWNGTPARSLRITSIPLTPHQVRQNFENVRSYTRTIYASPTGAGSGAGTEQQPLYLSSALALAGPAVKIILLPGSYDGRDFQVTRGGISPLDHCLITGQPGAAPAIISSRATLATVSGASDLLLRNLVFDTRGMAAALRLNNCPRRVTLDACRFGGTRGGLVLNQSPATVQNCLFNVADLSLQVVDTRGPIVRNNTFVAGTIAAQFDGSSDTLTVMNNLFSGQTTGGVILNNQSHRFYRGDGNIYAPFGNGFAARVLNNDYLPAQLIAYSRKWFDLDFADTGDSKNRRRGYAAESRSFTIDPVFENPSAGDFRLAPAAGNAIDAGVDKVFQRPVSAPLSDGLGAVRPQGNAVDVGAYETEAPFQQSFAFTNEVTASAGVYTTNGTLIKTLFSGRRLSNGVNNVYWNGLDDYHRSVEAGDYRVKLVAHNIRYVWEGVVGNNSRQSSGPSVHSHFQPIHDMAISGPEAFYVPGYNEGKYEIHRFNLSDPRTITKSFGPITDIFSDSQRSIATDGQWIYTMNSKELSAYSVSTSARIRFTGGQNEIQVGTIGTRNGRTSGDLRAVAVQQNGDILFAAHESDYQVYLFDKRSGGSLGSIVVTRPREMAVAPNGDLWVICQVNNQPAVARFANPRAAATPTTVITGLEAPLAVAVSPVTGDILVADGGSQQQVKGFDASGALRWTLGQRGGYANGPSVTTDKFGFGFREGTMIAETFLAVQSDGSFWVGDTATGRSLHYTAARDYIDQIIYVPHTYVASADPNNPTRVFNQWLEFQVDYSAPLSQGWTLVNYWGHGLPESAHGTIQEGLHFVATLSNNRTYALMPDGAVGSRRRLVELTASGIRLTPTVQIENAFSFEPDGSLVRTEPGPNNTVIFYRMPLTGFDAAGNPQHGAKTAVASAPASGTWMRMDPAGRNFHITSNLVVSFDDARDRNGWHLGAVKVGGNDWLWRASPAAGGLNGLGNFDTWVEYGGNLSMVSGRHIFYGFHGEFYLDQGQANQFMHFFDNGLFIGQFGQPMLFGVGFNAPGAAGNAFSPALVRVGEKLYLYHNDESSRGSHRWRIDGLDQLRELIAPISLDQVPRVIITAPEPRAAETGAQGMFEIRRAGPITNSLFVPLIVTGTASNGVDYVTLPQSVLFPVGVSVTNLAVIPIDDALKEGEETVVVGIGTTTNFNVSVPNQAVVTIEDDEVPTIHVSVTQPTASEEGPVAGRWSISRTGILTNSVVVNYQVGGNALNGVDYVSLPGSITLPAGVAAATLSLTPIDDTLVEGTETVELQLLANSEYNLGPVTSGTIVIEDDDRPTVSLNVGQSRASESGPVFGTVRVQRSIASSEPLTVYLRLAGTAVNGVDYITVPDSITIPAGFAYIDFRVTPINDTILEPTETVEITLEAHPDYDLAVNRMALIEIADNEMPPNSPEDLQAIAVSPTQILLYWNFTDPELTGFAVERSRDGINFTRIAILPRTAYEYLSSRLNPETTYYYRIRALNNDAESSPSPVASATTEATQLFPLFLKVNFQSTESVVPTGDEPDDGLVYGVRSSGFTYGWLRDNKANAVDRGSASSADPRFYTLNQMQVGGNNVWEAGIPNGNYLVHVVMGDPIEFGSFVSLTVENNLAIQEGTTADMPWLGWTGVVPVRDGRLTLANGPDAQRNKINFVEIYASNIPLLSIGGVTRRANGSFEMNFATEPGKQYTIQTSTNLTNWATLTVLNASSNLLNFVDQDAPNYKQRFYRLVSQ